MTELPFLPAAPDPTRPEREPRRRSHRHDYPRPLHGAPWPATCVNCTLTTEDPDAYFYPPDWDSELTEDHYRCPGSATGAHELGFRCLTCRAVQDPVRSRRGRQSRNYGNRAELDIARKHGGRKVGHAGGPADVLGATRKLQVKSTRRRPPAMWQNAFAGLDSIADSRLAVLLLRFVRAGNLGPEDFYVVRAVDFLAWYGIDGEATP